MNARPPNVPGAVVRARIKGLDLRPGRRNPPAPDVSKDRNRWPFARWAETAERFECVAEWSPHVGEIATIRGDGVSLVVYAHKTDGGAYTPRVRNSRSRDRAVARELVRALGLHMRKPI